MRREDELLRQKPKLLQNFSGVAMIEYGVGRKVLRHFNEMGFLRGLFASARDAGFGVADNAMIQINQAAADERRESQDDGCGIAACIRHQRGLLQLVAM